VSLKYAYRSGCSGRSIEIDKYMFHAHSGRTRPNIPHSVDTACQRSP